MTQQYRTRQRYYSAEHSELSAYARDAQEIMSKLPVTEQRVVETLYSEPLTIGQLLEEPFCIELVRVINLFAPQTPQKCGGMCHFTWLPQLNGAQVASIDGMSLTTDAAIRFRFYFRITYRLPTTS